VTQYIPPFVLCFLLLLLAYAVAHALCRHLHFLIRYGIGIALLCGGLALFGLLVNDVLFIAVPGFMAVSGIIVAVLYRNEDAADARARVARQAGEIVGMARGLHTDLTQEQIDRGIHGESRMDGPRRRN
jgi:hypothetical protein